MPETHRQRQPDFEECPHMDSEHYDISDGFYLSWCIRCGAIKRDDIKQEAAGQWKYPQERGLVSLLDFISGKVFPFGNGGITTYPQELDDRHARLHAGCLELERRGYIERHLDETTKHGVHHVVWKPKGAK